jgi:hypothetical protein
MYIKPMVNGIVASPLPAQSLPPLDDGDLFREKEIVGYIRKRYGRAKGRVEELISKWLKNPTI